MEIINCEKKEMILLTDEETKDLSYEGQKYPTYAKQSFVLSKMRKMNTKKSEIIDITQENLEELLIVLAI